MRVHSSSKEAYEKKKHNAKNWEKEQTNGDNYYVLCAKQWTVYLKVSKTLTKRLLISHLDAVHVCVTTEFVNIRKKENDEIYV